MRSKRLVMHLYIIHNVQLVFKHLSFVCWNTCLIVLKLHVRLSIPLHQSSTLLLTCGRQIYFVNQAAWLTCLCPSSVVLLRYGTLFAACLCADRSKMGRKRKPI